MRCYQYMHCYQKRACTQCRNFRHLPQSRQLLRRKPHRLLQVVDKVAEHKKTDAATVDDEAEEIKEEIEEEEEVRTDSKIAILA